MNVSPLHVPLQKCLLEVCVAVGVVAHMLFEQRTLIHHQRPIHSEVAEAGSGPATSSN